MARSKNSLTTLLNDLLQVQNDAYSLTVKVSDIVTSKAETVTVELRDSTGTIKKVQVPSFGALMNRIGKLEGDIKSLGAVGDASSSLQLSDGTFRKVLVSRLKKEADDVRAMAAPTTFATRENWFFESFLNPLLYVSFDLTGQVKSNTERVEVRRYILNLDSDAKVAAFNDRLKNASDVTFEEFTELLSEYSITYFLDEDVLDLPPRTVRYNGTFSVTDLTDATLTETVDGVEYQKRVLNARLDVLEYNDRESRFLRTQGLKIGDSLVVNNETQSTRYEIVAIDRPTRTVSLRRVEGFDPIRVGADSLLYYDEDDGPIEADVPVGFNEYCVVFVRPVDPDSKIAAVNWSPGAGFYSNELVISDASGEETTLETYYQNQVVDFGAYLFSMAKEKVPPSVLGVKPDSPALNASDFKVVQVNEHATTGGDVEQLRKLQSDKSRLQSELASIDQSIRSKRSKLETTNYPTKRLEDTDRTELDRMVTDRSSVSALFDSAVTEINRIVSSTGVDKVDPKYRVRGFFPIPEAKASTHTRNQEVVQFVIQYRYLRKDGSANRPEQIQFKDNTGDNRRGTFSTWVEVRSPVRSRVTDPDTGEVTWAVEDVEDGDAVNINQLDIPISKGEAVEVRVKSLSEAGWPVTPAESDWSDTVRVDFPSDLESIETVSTIVEDAQRERFKSDVRRELESLGLSRHVEGQVSQGERFFAHNAKDLNSGFFTADQVPISLFEKLTAMTDELAELRALIENAKGKLVVKVVDDIGQTVVVEPNSTVRLVAGNYRDEVADQPVKKGVIVTKNYFIQIYNEAATTLELYARNFGAATARVTGSNTGDADYNGSDSDYNVARRYDYVPVSLSSPDSADVAAYGFIREYPEQSSQVLGQFVGFRYKSVDGAKDLYSRSGGTARTVYDSRSQVSSVAAYVATQTEDLEYVAEASTLNALVTSTNVGSTAAGDFIWKGGTNGNWVIPSTDANVQSNLDTGMFIHVDHPLVRTWAQLSTSATAVNAAVEDAVRVSVFANVPSGSTGYYKQSALFWEGQGDPADKYAKIGFVDTDQYLIGPRSCGAYLFPSPKDHAAMRVDGADSLSTKAVRFNTREAITIPVTFQYRMTDYFGAGNAGLGNIGGDPTAGTNANLKYTKTLGIDVYSNPKDKDRFSFDLQVEARYYSTNLSSKDVPLRTFENAVDDFTRTVTVNPSTSRDR